MKEGQDFIFNYQSYSATMKNGLETANNLIFTYNFESKKWTEIGYLNANSWQMTSISLQNQTIVPIECESLAIMCSRDRYVQMALINN